MSDLLGYRRANETWGVRNHVLVMPVQAAASTAAEQLAAAIPGAVAVTHQWDGDRDDRDALLVQRTLAGFCANPNVAISSSRRCVRSGSTCGARSRRPATSKAA